MKMPSAADIVEVHRPAGSYNRKIFTKIKCLPWMRRKDQYDYLILEITRPKSAPVPVLWVIFGRSTKCFGKLADVLKAVLNHYEANTGEELYLPGTNDKAFGKRFR
eukprot:TRINITY_DN1152_c0_g1_i2.p1 TRINITY_DN1152_c0_g1~~TRINITY_DN1152_c0_g1_i2.p1  ORF type:complete len:106 (+),score=12.81 TRINITY_DN1152_c0_g1_i2:788-1105(+)